LAISNQFFDAASALFDTLFRVVEHAD